MTTTALITGEAADGELVSRWRNGDERAAAALVDRHGPALARYAASLGCREDAEDLVHDTFVRAFASLGGYRGESSFLTWLLSIERRLVLDRYRASRRQPELAPLDDSFVGSGSSALDDLLEREASGRLQEAVERLPPMQRSVLTLRVSEGLSYREIALVAGTTEGAARVHYHNAMRALKESLND